MPCLRRTARGHRCLITALMSTNDVTAFVFFLLRDHVPVTVIERAMMDARQHKASLDGYPELAAFSESVARYLLDPTEVGP